MSDKVLDALISIVYFISESPIRPDSDKQFPFHHYTSGALETVYYQTVLVPDDYLTMSKCGRDDLYTCYEITSKGYELLRPYLSDKQIQQGDVYYGFEA